MNVLVRSPHEEPHLGSWVDTSWAYFLHIWAKILICWCLTLLQYWAKFMTSQILAINFAYCSYWKNYIIIIPMASLLQQVVTPTYQNFSSVARYRSSGDTHPPKKRTTCEARCGSSEGTPHISFMCFISNHHHYGFRPVSTIYYIFYVALHICSKLSIS